AMSESVVITIVYEQGEERWVVASIPEVSGAHSQGRTREEARASRSSLLSAREAPRPRAPSSKSRRAIVAGGRQPQLLGLRCLAFYCRPTPPRDRLPACTQDLCRPRDPAADWVALNAFPLSEMQ